MALNQNDIASFGPAKEVISLHFLLRLHYDEVLHKETSATASLVTYRRNIAWTLIQPHGSTLRAECFRWVIMIGDQFPSIFVNIIEEYMPEGSAQYEFLKKEHQYRVDGWKESLVNDSKVSLKDWMSSAWIKGRDTTEAGNNFIHHCFVLKLMQKLLDAYKNGDEEAKKVVQSL